MPAKQPRNKTALRPFGIDARTEARKIARHQKFIAEIQAEYAEKKRKQVATEIPILRYFAFAHLPEKLLQVSKPFGELAIAMAGALPPGPELSAGLRKLLEAKDCMVRASLDIP